MEAKFSNRVKEVISLSREEALRLGHDYIGTEHLILGMISLYHNATQMACVIAAPVVAMLAFFANPVLMAWTGKPNIAHQAAPILALYAIGNGLAWLSSFPYYLQYAKGNLRLHLIGNTVQLLFLVPLIFFAAEHYGPVGTGTVWALSNALFFLIYVPIVHARFIPRTHGSWLYRDILPIIVPVAVAGELLSFNRPSGEAYSDRLVESAVSSH